MQAVNVRENGKDKINTLPMKNKLVKKIDEIIRSILKENPDTVYDEDNIQIASCYKGVTIAFKLFKNYNTGEITYKYSDGRKRNTTAWHGDVGYAENSKEVIRGRIWPLLKIASTYEKEEYVEPYRKDIEKMVEELGIDIMDLGWEYKDTAQTEGLKKWKKSSGKNVPDIEIPPDIKRKIDALQALLHTTPPGKEKDKIEKEIDDLYKQAGVANRKEREKLAYIAATSKKMVPFEKGGGGSVAGYKYAKGMPAIAEDKVKIYNKTLCPKLWDENKKLNPEVRDTLLKIAFDFYSDSDLRIPIQDVYLLGSSANYNWSPTGDLDVHILLDVATLSMHPENAEKFLHTLTGKWNLEHDIKVKGHRVELYLQDIREENKSTAVYSLVQDQWIKEPNPEKISLDKDLIQKKYSLWVQKINDAIKREDEKALKNILEALKDYRQCGLDKQGEFSPENIVFKILRAKGFLKKIKDGYNQLYDKKMTVKETGTYMNYGHEAGATLWGYDKTGEFKKKISKGPHDFHVDSGGFIRMDYNGRYDPNKNVITVADMANVARYREDTDVESLPEDLIRRLKFEFGDDARIKRFHEGKDINDGFDPTSMGPNPEATEGQIDNGSFYSGHIRKMRQLEEAKVKDLKSTYPKVDFDWEGNIPFDKLTMDNLVSIRKKIGRFYRDSAHERDIKEMQILSRIYSEIDDELKKRLKYINRPIKEENDVKETIKTSSPEEMEGEDYDRLDNIVKKSGINILSDKELFLVYYVNDVVVGGLFTAYNQSKEIFDFDIVVDPEYKHLAIGLRMIKDAIREYEGNILDMDPEAKMICDVVNPKLVRIMEMLGFKVVEKKGDHTMMLYVGGNNEMKNESVKEESVTNNQDIKSKYFTIKFNDPRVSKGAGIILFGDEWFANAIRMPSGYGRFENKWVINRHTGAFKMGLEAEEIGFDKVEDLLKYLDDWYEKNKPAHIKETDYYKDEDEDDEDAKYAEAERYFSIGQEDEETMAKSYCWIWDNRTQSILAKKGGTHSINFGYGRKDNTFSGWYDPEKNAISIVFPEYEARKLGGRKPTEDDIPQSVYSKLISKFGKRKPRFFVFEGYGAGIPEEDRLHIKGHRWQIRSKDAPKTPKISEEMEMLVNEILDKIIPINEFVKSKLPIIGRLTKDFNIKAKQARTPDDTHRNTVGWSDDDLMWRYRSDLNVFYYWARWNVYSTPSPKERFVLQSWVKEHFGKDTPDAKFVHVEASDDIYKKAHGVSESLLMKSPNQI